MQIFNNVKGYNSISAQRKAAHQQYLQERGITEEEYQLELEEQARKKHQEYLDRVGITEEEFLRRKSKTERRLKLKESFSKYGTITALLVGFVIFVVYLVSEDFRNDVEPIILMLGSIWLLYIFIMLCVPVYLLANNFIEHLKWNRFTKLIVALIITLLVVVAIGGLLHTCYSGSGSDNYEPILLRPDHF